MPSFLKKLSTDNLIRATSILAAIIYWLAETCIHYFIFDQGHAIEFWPSDHNELWMRLFTFILIMTLGFVVAIVYQKDMEKERENLATFRSTMNTVQDLVNNFLMQVEAINVKNIDGNLSVDDITDFYESSRQLHRELKDLSNLEKLKYSQTSSGTPYIDKQKS